VGWVVTQDPPDYSGKVVARLVTNASSPYVLKADTLGELHAKLPPRLVRRDRQPADPSELVRSVWRGSRGPAKTASVERRAASIANRDIPRTVVRVSLTALGRPNYRPIHFSP
jgi:hypothetical protein